jgi:hypothetical protein
VIGVIDWSEVLSKVAEANGDVDELASCSDAAARTSAPISSGENMSMSPLRRCGYFSTSAAALNRRP